MTAANDFQTKSMISDKLFSRDFLESLNNIAYTIVKNNYHKKAFDLSSSLDKVLHKHKADLEINAKVNDFYRTTITQLKFIAIPLMENKDILDLINNHFMEQFNLDDYDMIEKLKTKITFTEVFDNKVKLKKLIANSLLNNKETITKNSELKTIVGWLTDYNSHLGLNRVDKLKKAQYLTDLKKHRDLSTEEIKRLKTLFDLYEWLKLDPDSDEGFDEEIPVEENGKLYILRQGVLDPVKSEDEINQIIGGKISNQRKDKPSEELNNLSEIRDQFPAGSLERKAIEEEMKKLGG
jgi:hypothetical protein